MEDDRPVFDTETRRHLFAAYQMGGTTPILDLLPDRMNPTEFETMMTDHLSIFDKIWAVNGERPLGIIVTRGAEIHALWYGWATPRQRLEGSARWLDEYRKKNWGIVVIPSEQMDFFNRLKDYGLLVRVGTFAHHPEGRKAVYEVNHVNR